ncbi:TerD family protein [Cellulomonas cellasea]|uniref:Tellurium resistance protein terE n=2 Tax=Cellulomonas cellasea TaxID=43670 RepID=A0A0A0B926_9CELL|nr:TerD family protein [Cellulomonas cellasea]KGM02662.1 tellurium resistance protein terE [Cellulomonas cellasea DSM 20118]GEA89860.1 stress response protein, TerZ- and CABP1 [Cellulomonas cellasea]
MDDVVLSKGANTALPDGTTGLQVVVTWDDPDGSVDVDAAALLLDAGGRVRTDEDFVFYNQPASTDGSVRHLGRSSTDAGAHELLALDLATVPDDVHTLAVVASLADGTFGRLDGLRMLVLDAVGAHLARYDIVGATTETAFLFGEVYRRSGEWKVRAVGQGWDTGLAGIASDFGVTVDDSDDDHADAATRPPAEAEQPAEPTTPAVPAGDDAAPGTVDRPETVDEVDPSRTDPPAADADELVEVVESASEPPEIGAVVELSRPVASLTAVPTPAPSNAPRRRTAGVRTAKRSVAVVTPPRLRLAVEDTWTPARLFSISGVGTADEQEKRTTSALLATVMGVPAFARALTARFGAPAGTVEAYLEVQFRLGETTVIPDGVLRVSRGTRLWTGLVEVKTGSGQLAREQVEHYLDVARQEGYDALITLSNEIAPQAGEHPVTVDRRKLRKTALLHLSWAEVLHEAKVTLHHRGVADQLQAWLLHELIRYLEHPRSGAASFDDMGPSWVPVRESVHAGTLRPTDRKVPAVADSWTRLVRQLCLRLSSDLGVTVTHALPRRLATDSAARIQAIVAQLSATGELEAVLKVPLAAGPLTVTADLRTSQVKVAVALAAPQEGTGPRRIAWLLRQLRDAPDALLVEAVFTGRSDSACERLVDVRADASVLLPDRSAEISAFRLTLSSPMGTKRSGVRGAFVPSVTSAVEAFYSTVVQPLKPWVPAAPRLPEDVRSEALADQAEDLAELAQDAG